MSRPCVSSVLGVAVLSLTFLCAACDRSKGGETALARGEVEPLAGDPSKLERRGPEASSLGISGQSLLFARGLQDGTIRVREGRDGEHRRTLAGDGGAVTALSFSPDGVYLASAYQDGTVRLWDPRSGREVSTRRDHSTRVDALIFSPDGSRLVSVGRDLRLLIYDIPEARDARDLTAHATHWAWVIMPVKAKVLPPSMVPEAPGPEQNASAGTAQETGEVIFRPVRLRVETEYVGRSTLRHATDAHATAERSLFDRSGEALAHTQPEPEMVVAVTLSLDRSADLGGTTVNRVSFRLSPCAMAGSPCPAPELTLGFPQDALAKAEATSRLTTAATRAQSFSSVKVIDPAEPLAIVSGGEAQALQATAFEMYHGREARRHSYSYHLSLLSVARVLGTRQIRRLRESVRRRPEEWLSVYAEPAVAESFVAFSRDSSVVSWASSPGLIQVYDLRRNRHLQLVALAQGAGRGEWRAHLLDFKRVKNFASPWSRWEIRNSDWSFLLVRVFLENLLRDRSFLPLSGVHLRSEDAFYPAVGVLDQGLHRRPGVAEVSVPEQGEGAQVFVFVVPHSVQGGLMLHILDLEPIELVD